MRMLASVLAVCLTAAPAASVFQEPQATLGLPTTARAVALALVPGEDTLVVGTRRRLGADELFVVEFAADGTHPGVRWSLDLDAHVRAVVVEAGFAYVATSDDAAELIVVDLTQRQRVAALDAPGTGNGEQLTVVAPGEVLLQRRPGDGPEVYRVTMREGALVVLESAEAPWPGRRPRSLPLCCYRVDRGIVITRVRRVVPGGALHFLLTTHRRAALHIVRETTQVAFPDVDGDGLYRLACLGDSNTAPFWPARKWCEQLSGLLLDRHFATLNLAVPGATVTSTPAAGAGAQLDAALASGVDAVVAAFGTNDVFWGRRPTEIRDAYLALAARAAAAGLAFYVATTPPIVGGCPACAETNELLRAAFPGRVLDFDTGFTARHFVRDGYHVNQDGQDLRALRAAELLRWPPAE